MSDNQEILNLVNSLGLTDIADVAQQFLYQGFSPEMVLRHLAKIKKEKNISNVDFQRDIKTILAIGVVMGNFNDHNSGRIADEGKTIGEGLFTKYAMKKGSIGNEKKAVTIPRMLATFPIVTTKIMIQIGPKSYNNHFYCSSLPNFMKSGVFPSLIPSELSAPVKAVLMTISTCFTTEQSMVISNLKDAVSTFELQKKFTVVSHQSTVPSEEERVAFFKELRFDFSAMEKIITRHKEVIKGSEVNMVAKEAMSAAGLNFG